MIPPGLSISLVIVTYAREARLLEQLAYLRPYNIFFSEIIIVDNGKSLSLEDAVTALFGDKARIIQPPENLGAVGRSLGIMASIGDIVLTLDDDVRLSDPQQLSQLQHLFAADHKVGCVNFRIHYNDQTLDLSDWCHPRDPFLYAGFLFETTYISEGACAFRGRLVRELGAYPADLFIGQEGVELAARIIDAGYALYYLPSVTAVHAVASEGRASGRQFYYNTRNIYWIALRCYPLRLLLSTIWREWTILFIFALLNRALGFLLRGYRDALICTPQLLQQRRPISADSAKRIRLINSLKPSWYARFRRIRMSKTLR